MQRKSRIRPELLTLASLLLAACGGGTSDLAIQLSTDFVSPSEFDRYVVTLDESDSVEGSAAGFVDTTPQRIAEFAELTRGRHSVEISLFRGGAFVARRGAEVQLNRSQIITLSIARSCSARLCPGSGDPPNATECDFSGCVAPECTPETPEGCEPSQDGGSTGRFDSGTERDGGDTPSRDGGGATGLDAGPTTMRDGGDDPTDAGPGGTDAGPGGTDAGPGGTDAGPGGTDAGPACPPDPCAGQTCSDHGWCVGGTCLCDFGYSGSTCNSCGSGWIAISATGCAPINRIDGTDAADAVLDGTAAGDYIRALGGNDTLVRGLDGNDRVNGNEGRDRVNGNRGRDTVLGGSEDDEVLGGSEDDYVAGGRGNDTVVGGLGNDRMQGNEGDDLLEDASGNDRYVIDGLGNDTIDDLAGVDEARCWPGVRLISDRMSGSDRLLSFNTGGTLRIRRNAVETIYCCF